MKAPKNCKTVFSDYVKKKKKEKDSQNSLRVALLTLSSDEQNHVHSQTQKKEQKYRTVPSATKVTQQFTSTSFLPLSNYIIISDLGFSQHQNQQPEKTLSPATFSRASKRRKIIHNIYIIFLQEKVQETKQKILVHTMHKN